MQRYQNAFFITMAAALLLFGAVVYLWFHPRLQSSQANVSTPSNPAISHESAEPKLAPVTLTPERMQSIGVKTGTVEYRNANDVIRTTGTIEVDETRLADVELRFSGWIQKVYADSTFQQVQKGQPLLTVYSPDLVTTENEYLLARQNRDLLAQSSVPGVASGAASLLSSAADRLEQWQIPSREIRQLEASGTVQRVMEIDSPVSGFITQRNALPNMYVQPGTKLYSVADLSTVWVYAQIFQNDIGRVKSGDSVEITVDSYPGRTFPGRVSFIWPQLDEATRTAKARLEIANPDLKLSLGMFVNALLRLPLGRQLVIPASGVFQTGTRQIAFVDQGSGYFEPREIETGARAGDDVVVVKGLKSGERVVTSANFLIDSESQIQAALGSFAPPPAGAGAAAAMNTTQPQVAIDFSSNPATPHQGSNTFRVKLARSDGAPVLGAQVTLTLFMPAMPAMGMAAMRTVTTLAEKGGGIYEGAGQLKSGGTWQVTAVATRDGQTLAQKQFNITAEGGMQ